MTMKREHAAERKVIAFDFYDGATEGFAECLLDGSDCYFTLIAWDSDQENRLYAAAKVERTLYARVISLFGKVQEIPSLPVWIPRWEFADTIDESEASELVRSCRSRLSQEGSLLLTRQIGEKPSRMAPITADIAPKVGDILVRGTPDDLVPWLEYLSWG